MRGQKDGWLVGWSVGWFVLTISRTQVGTGLSVGLTPQCATVVLLQWLYWVLQPIWQSGPIRNLLNIYRETLTLLCSYPTILSSTTYYVYKGNVKYYVLTSLGTVNHVVNIYNLRLVSLRACLVTFLTRSNCPGGRSKNPPGPTWWLTGHLDRYPPAFGNPSGFWAGGWSWQPKVEPLSGQAESSRQPRLYGQK